MPRSRIATTGILVVSPFKIQFDQLLADLEVYDQAIRDELQILQFQQGQHHLRSSTIANQHLIQMSRQATMNKDEIIKEFHKSDVEPGRRLRRSILVNKAFSPCAE